MKKKPHKKQEPKPPAPPTYQEVMKAKGWGQGDRAMHPEPGKDRYFVTAGGKADDEVLFRRVRQVGGEGRQD